VVVHLAVVPVPPVSAGRVSLLQRTDPHGNLCLPGHGTAGWVLDSRRNADTPFDVHTLHWAFLVGGAQSDHLPSGLQVGAAEVSFREAQHLALGLLAVKSAMRKIIAWRASRGGRRTGSSPCDYPPRDLAASRILAPKGHFFAAAPSTQEFPK